jgi:tagatose-6-phosphate ketose/aldose isomerase
MDYLGMSQHELEQAGGYWTAREIAQQPAVWVTIQANMTRDAEALRAYLDPLLEQREMRIVLTGAGTSSFVGDCLAPALGHKTGRRVDVVATTDLVASPGWLASEAPLLLVSFARSGNSPESVAALNLVQQMAPGCHHLIVTCNQEGDLYRIGHRMQNARVVLLPEETNDRGFAMTSSFSGMLLATALAFDLLPQDLPSMLASWSHHVLGARLPFIARLARAGFERVVYLGSKEFKGLAREAALKMLELSDGKIVAVSDTPLGFRHGPKTIVNGRTLVVMFLCNDPYTRRYELDVLSELRADGVAAQVVALSAGDTETAAQADAICVPGAEAAKDLALCFPYAVFAQTLALLQSLALGLRPDTPNAKGVVNRVVQGVSIYPWDPKR